MADAQIRVKQILDNSQFKKGLKDSKNATSQLSSQIKQLGGMIAGAFSVGAIVNFAKSAGEAYDRQMKAEAKVRQAVKQTGGAAGYSAEELGKMASQLQKVTTYGDEDILNKVTAQLLSFPKITGAVFKDAQKAVLDVATLLDGDIQASAIAIGKALQDPVKGITAMRRMGIMFSETQQEQIKNLVEQGKLYEAQESILKEINIQYGGQAEAAAKTGLGALQQLNNAWGDFKEQWFAANLGGKNGWIKPFAEGLDYMTWRMEEFKKSGGGFAEWWKRFLKIGEYSEDAYNMAQNAEKNADQLKKNADILQGVTGGFKSYADMVNASAEAANKFIPKVEKSAEQLAEEAKAAEAAVKAHEEYLKGLQAIRDKDAEFASGSRMSSLSGGAEMNTGLFLRTGEMRFDLPTEDVKEFDATLRNSFEGMTTFSEKFETFAESLIDISGMVQEAFVQLGNIVVQGIEQIVTALVSGTGDMADVMNGIMGMMGDWLKQMGEALIAYGLAKLVASLTASVSGPVAIAAGLALTVAGSALSAAFAQPPKMAAGGIVPGGYPGDTYPALLTSGEMVIPPHKLESVMGKGLQTVNVTGVIRGQDIYLINEKQSSKLSRYR